MNKSQGYDKDSVIAAYKQSGNLRGACEMTGAPPYIAFIWLKKAGLLTSTDKSRFGSRASKLGAEAEKEFQRLVPKAMCANKHLESNCPSFDFDVMGATVDVKYSSIRPSTGRWCFKTAAHKTMCPDWYAAFFAIEENGDLSRGYHLLLIPHYAVSDLKYVELNPANKHSDWWLFKITPENLQKCLTEGEYTA